MRFSGSSRSECRVSESILWRCQRSYADGDAGRYDIALRTAGRSVTFGRAENFLSLLERFARCLGPSDHSAPRAGQKGVTLAKMRSVVAVVVFIGLALGDQIGNVVVLARRRFYAMSVKVSVKVSKPCVLFSIRSRARRRLEARRAAENRRGYDILRFLLYLRADSTPK